MKKIFSSYGIMILSAALLATSPACTPAPKYCGGRDSGVKQSAGRKKTRKETEQPVRPARFLDPVKNFSPSRINSNFGLRTHPLYHTKEFHPGIDITGVVGEDVYAVAAGSIIFSGKQRGYGKVLIVDHGNRLYSVYAHLSVILAAKGASVNAGERIGKIGLTGNSTGAHLHFEVRKGEKAVNPLDYLR